MTAPERVPLTPAPVAVDGHPTTAAGAGTLAYAIARWHAAHPDFVRVLECVAPIVAVTVAVPPPTSPISERGAAIAAGRLGITVEEYRRHEEDGERWCSWCAAWRPNWRNAPSKRTQPYCPDCWGTYQRGLHQRRNDWLKQARERAS